MTELHDTEDAVGFAVSRQQRLLWSTSRPADADPDAEPDAEADEATIRVSLELGDADPALVRSRLETSVAVHEALRTRVVVPEGLAVPVQVVDASSVVRAQIAGGHLQLQAPLVVADASTLERLAAVAIGAETDVSDPIQYAEYAQWQSELDDEPAATDFWATVSGHSSALPALAITSTPERAAIAGSAPAVASDARAPFARWCAATVVAVHRLTGEAQVCIGVEIDARNGEELIGAAGPYTETVPLCLTMSDDTTLAELAAACDRLIADSTTHLEWIPEHLAALGAELSVVLARGAADTVVPRLRRQLEVRVSSDGQAVALAAEARVPAALLYRIVAAAPSTRIGELDLVTDTGLAASSLSAPVPAASGTSVLARIAEHMHHRPELPALTQGATTLTYGELAASVRAVCDGLDGTDAPIALVADRSLGALVGLLAALWSGRGYVPLPPGQPARRLLSQLTQSGATMLLLDEAADAAPWSSLDAGLKLVRVSPRARAEGPLPSPPSGDATAYVIYTSGSTGTPKGVEVTHRNLAAYVDGVSEALRPEAAWRWALATPPSTDLGNTALFVCLATGAELSVLSQDEVSDPTDFASVLAAGPIDAVKMTPSHLAGLVTGVDDAVLPAKLIVLGGEPLTWSLVDQLRALTPARIVNHYGPTETTVGVLTYEVTGTEQRHAATVPVGRPLPGVFADIRTADLHQVPAGGLGELVIGGTGVTRGYRGAPQETAAAFVDDPLGVGARIYRTGDLAWLQPDGVIQFAGRRDGQVKVRGFRVETGEIESALLEHPAVRRSAVVMRTDSHSGEPMLVAYVVSNYHPSPTPDELRTHLGARVPAHMIPAAFTDLEVLPLTANGKLDRAALPEPDPQGSSSTVFAVPANAIETEIASVYAELLNCQQVGRHDDFFRLGGHSLLATQAVLRIRKALAVELPMHVIFAAPTVAGLAHEVEQLVLSSADSAEIADLLAKLDGLSDEEVAAHLADGFADDL